MTRGNDARESLLLYALEIALFLSDAAGQSVNERIILIKDAAIICLVIRTIGGFEDFS